jgi:hypothetical protein
MNDPDLKLLFWLVVLGSLAAAGWYFRDDILLPAEDTIVELPAAEPPPAVVDTSPRHPIEAPEPPPSEERALVPLPPLDDSDAYFLLEIAAIFGSDIESLLLREAVIDRLVTTVDNLPRGQISDKIRPVGRLPTTFSVDESLVLGAENFERYDAVVRYIAVADINAIADMYRRFYPLFQQSYERLGYPNAYFNDRFVEVIDHLLATPVPNDPVVLIRPNVLYEFENPTYEGLSSGQKLLLRMGNDHAAVLKDVLRRLRNDIAGSQ